MLTSRVSLLYLAGQHHPRLSTMRTWVVLIPAGSTVERSILDDWEIDGSSPSRGTLPFHHFIRYQNTNLYHIGNIDAGL